MSNVPQIDQDLWDIFENVLPFDDSRPSSRSSSHYFSDLEDMSPYIAQMPIEHVTTDTKQTLGKRRADEDGQALRQAKSLKTSRSFTQSRSQSEQHRIPVVIAHLPDVPSEEVERLPFGAQWEIARLLSNGTTDVSGTFDRAFVMGLPATNVDAVPEIHAQFFSSSQTKISAKEQELRSPWQELDKEQMILSIDPYGGLGCNSDKPYLQDDPNWYGGRIHFTAKLLLLTRGVSGDPTMFKLRLDPPANGSSNRFARRFGSYCILRVTISDDMHFSLAKKSQGLDDLQAFFHRPVVMHSWVFRAFYAKEGSVFLFRTRERFNGSDVVDQLTLPPGPAREMTLQEFLSWHNDLSNNLDQSMAKWAARFALGLSNSVPGVRLEASCIREEKDIVCDAYKKSHGKAPSEMIMTDGCGLVSRSVLAELRQSLSWSLNEPTAVQMRIGGAKGLLLAHPQFTSPADPFRVSLRPSQIKIRYSRSGSVHGSDPAMLTLDVVKPGRLTSAAQLSEETIINLAENGVPASVFVALMQANLRGKVDDLTTWTSPASPYTLYGNISKTFNVVNGRLVRESVGAARARGLVSYDRDERKKGVPVDEDEDGWGESDDVLKEQSTAWWGDPTSGCPSTIQETILVLLDSGFLPDTCPILAFKLRKAVETVIYGCANKYHIAVPMSCITFVVPDPCGVLASNEVHIKSSSRNLLDDPRTHQYITQNDLTRHPCKVPTDVQKVKAVYKAELRDFVDVLVVSTKSHLFGSRPLNRHLASMTGGGDYDGDTMQVFWDPTLVAPFKNADPKYAEEPRAVRSCLRKNPKTVRQFLEESAKAGPAFDRMKEIQTYLLGSLQDPSRVGTLSNYWERAIYEKGYTHNDTVFFAYMFTNILDGGKTGVSIDKTAFGAHHRSYNRSLPLPWKDPSISVQPSSPSKREFAQRAESLPIFIMDILKHELEEECRKQLNHLNHLFPDKNSSSAIVPLDSHLAAPWNDAIARAHEVVQARGETWMQQELDAIYGHVKQFYVKHKQIVGMGSRWPGKKSKGGVAFSALPIERRQDAFRELSHQFENGPAWLPDGSPLLCFDKVAIRRLRASCAYVVDRQSWAGWSGFPWNVAMRTLCQIKVEATGGGKTMLEEFYHKMTIAKAFVRQS